MRFFYCVDMKVVQEMAGNPVGGRLQYFTGNWKMVSADPPSGVPNHTKTREESRLGAHGLKAIPNSHREVEELARKQAIKWLVETSDKSQVTKTCNHASLQNGINKNGKWSYTGRGLANEAGPKGCISNSPHMPRPSGVSEVL